MHEHEEVAWRHEGTGVCIPGETDMYSARHLLDHARGPESPHLQLEEVAQREGGGDFFMRESESRDRCMSTSGESDRTEDLESTRY